MKKPSCKFGKIDEFTEKFTGNDHENTGQNVSIHKIFEKILKIENAKKPSKYGHFGRFLENDKSIIRMPRQYLPLADG